MAVRKKYKYYDLIMAAFVAVILCSNLIGVHKVSYVNIPYYGEFIYGAGILFFPIAYLFGDILTEVYGYARSRKVIWAGFGGNDFCIVYVLCRSEFAFGFNNGRKSPSRHRNDFWTNSEDCRCFYASLLDG